MRYSLLVLMLFGLSSGAWGQPVSTTYTFPAPDGVTIHADLHRASDDTTAPLILLFHQGGGDVRGEYQRILPLLLEEGNHVLAADLRRGGDRFGSTNRTVAGLPEGSGFSYCDALTDVIATHAFADTLNLTGPRLAWGSSFSAALVLELAVAHPDALAGVLAFSPASGDPMGACQPLALVDRLDLPVLVLRPETETVHAHVADQLARFADHGHQTYVAQGGVHGSSMLDPERATTDPSPTWDIVRSFLRSATQHR